MHIDGISVATGEDFPDALAGINLCSYFGETRTARPIILVNESSSSIKGTDEIIGKNCLVIHKGYILGDDGVVSAACESRLKGYFPNTP